MASEYNKQQRILSLGQAIKMRDHTSIDKIHGKLKYSVRHIQWVTGIKAYEMVHIGLMPNKEQMKQMRQFAEAMAANFKNNKRKERGKAPLHGQQSLRFSAGV